MKTKKGRNTLGWVLDKNCTPVTKLDQSFSTVGTLFSLPILCYCTSPLNDPNLPGTRSFGWLGLGILALANRLLFVCHLTWGKTLLLLTRDESHMTHDGNS